MKVTATIPSLAALLLAFSAAGQATSLLSENFNELTTGLAVTSVGAFSAIDGTNVDIVGPNLGLCASPESGNCIDLAGSGGNPQGKLQSNTAFALAPGTNYFLSFDLIGSGRGDTDSATVTFAGYNKTFVLASGDTTSGIVTNALVTVTTPGSYNLTFTNNISSNIGLLLDNVSISTAPATPITTPEPSSLLLTIPGFLACYAFNRRGAARKSLAAK